MPLTGTGKRNIGRASGQARLRFEREYQALTKGFRYGNSGNSHLHFPRIKEQSKREGDSKAFFMQDDIPLIGTFQGNPGRISDARHDFHLNADPVH